jgi:hypothetical protein
MTKQPLSWSYPEITKVYMDPNYTQYMFLISGLQYRTGFRANGPLQGEKKVVLLTGLYHWPVIYCTTFYLVADSEIDKECWSHIQQIILNSL